MSKELIARIDNALRVKDAWVTDGQIEATAQLLRDCRSALSARGEAVTARMEAQIDEFIAAIAAGKEEKA